MKPIEPLPGSSYWEDKVITDEGIQRACFCPMKEFCVYTYCPQCGGWTKAGTPACQFFRMAHKSPSGLL